jgi:hypothetical protein
LDGDENGVAPDVAHLQVPRVAQVALKALPQVDSHVVASQQVTFQVVVSQQVASHVVASPQVASAVPALVYHPQVVPWVAPRVASHLQMVVPPPGINSISIYM